MVKEIELLPEMPKSLTNFDPTKFRPDWKASGRRWRVDKAAKCLGKKILNCDERGEVGEISKKVFLNAFEIYIHATHYNTEDAFVCNECPGELVNGEEEDDFENNCEVHICDGIGMGNMQYPTKGLVERWGGVLRCV